MESYTSSCQESLAIGKKYFGFQNCKNKLCCYFLNLKIFKNFIEKKEGMHNTFLKVIKAYFHFFATHTKKRGRSDCVGGKRKTDTAL